jgi:hypothetical protein
VSFISCGDINNTFGLQKKIYSILPRSHGIHFSKTTLEVRQFPDGAMKIVHQGRMLEVVERSKALGNKEDISHGNHSRNFQY